MDKVEKEWQPIKIINLVRCPRDRLVSYTLHYRNFPNKIQYDQRTAETDLEAYKISATVDNVFRFQEQFTYKTMMEYPFLHSKDAVNSNIVWTTYERLNLDTRNELESIINFISNKKIDVIRLDSAINNNTFEKLSKGRAKGIEDKTNVRQRKGIIGDYKNKFDRELFKLTEDNFKNYWKIIWRKRNET